MKGKIEFAEFMPKKVFLKSKDCVFIVGQNPGSQRQGHKTFIAWEGNKSADLMNEAVNGIKNLYMTNIVNIQAKTISDKMVDKGISRLRADIKKHKPILIIYCGLFAWYNGKKALKRSGHKCEIHHALHPSFVIRFKRDKQEWKDEIRNKIHEARPWTQLKH